MFLAGVLEYAYISFLPTFGTRSGLSEASSLRLVTAFLWGGVLLAPVFGYAADRIKRSTLRHKSRNKAHHQKTDTLEKLIKGETMHALIILASPEPQSTNARLAKGMAEKLVSLKWAVDLVDLYAENFNALESPANYRVRARAEHFDAQIEQRAAFENGTLPHDVARHVNLMEKADLVIFQFPLWWFGLPAILKGWMDRVFLYGRFYTSQKRYERGHLAGKRAFMSITCGDSSEACTYNGIGGDLGAILWPSMYALRFVGFSILQPTAIYGVHGGLNAGGGSGDIEQRIAEYKLKLTKRLTTIMGEEELLFNRWDHYDENHKLLPDAPVYSPFIRHKKNIDQASAWPGLFQPKT